MDKDWSAFNVKYLAIPMTMLMFGLVIGFGLAHSEKKPNKEYPLVVRLCYDRAGYYDMPDIKCDSVKGDTIWRDGLQVINKHIVSVEYR